MSLRDEVLDALAVHGPRDDDRLGHLLGRNRHYINQVCRRLVEEGLATRSQGPDGKLVTRLRERPTGDFGPTVVPERPQRLRRHERARQNIDALVARFGECVRSFEMAESFAGPSLYFHEQALERRRSSASMDQLLGDVRFFEYVYAVLPSWGMHRMGRQDAKVGGFQEMMGGFARHRDELHALADVRITSVNADQRDDLARRVWSIIADVEVSTSQTNIVAGSKALHHLLPDLVPPIDRQYTFRFFTGQKAVGFGERQAFLEWFPLLCELGERANPAIRTALQRGGFMATGEGKIIDNAIIGFMRQRDELDAVQPLRESVQPDEATLGYTNSRSSELTPTRADVPRPPSHPTTPPSPPSG